MTDREIEDGMARVGYRVFTRSRTDITSDEMEEIIDEIETEASERLGIPLSHVQQMTEQDLAELEKKRVAAAWEKIVRQRGSL